MSLLTQATPWNQEINKKKPRMKERFQSIQDTIKNSENDENINNNRNKKVESIIEKMTNMNDDSSDLADFNPELPKPPKVDDLIPKIENMVPDIKRAIPNDINDLYDPIESYENNGIEENFEGMDPTSVYKRKGSSYVDSYQPHISYNNNSVPMRQHVKQKPSYSADTDLIEKINYMIHLLEEQKKEPTQNILEEYILYCLLGVFMIYLVDSFTKAGKYVR